MNPQNLVTNLELSKRLFEEGITKDVESVFWWVKHLPLSSAGIGWRVELKRSTPDSLKEESFPALTLEELLDIVYITSLEKFESDGTVSWFANIYKRPQPKGYETPLQALSSLTTWLLDEGYLKANS